MSNIVFYPGAFNPFHIGHLKIAEIAAEKFGRVFIAPHHDKPSSKKNHARLEDRANMIQSVIKERRGLELYLAEKNVYVLERENKFRHREFLWFMEKFSGFQGYILIGSDKLKQDMYADPKSELLLVPHIIFTREGLSEEDRVVLNNFKEVVTFESPTNISATEVKKKLSRKESVKELLPPEIEVYILRTGIYTS